MTTRLHLFPTLRAKLLVLLAGTMVPLLLLALGFAVTRYQAERGRLDEISETVARNITLGVTREVHRGLAGLSAIALSRPLCAGDLEGFRQQLAAFVQSQHPGANALLSDRTGQQLINLLAVPGKPLPRRRNVDIAQQVLDGGRAVVSDVYAGTFQPRVVSLEVPVTCEGDRRYALALIPRLEIFTAVLEAQRPPAGWSVRLIDARGQPIAELAQREGRRDGAALLADMRPRFTDDVPPRRYAELVDRELHYVYSRSEEIGWGALVSRPVDLLASPMAWSLTLLTGAALMLCLLGALFALTIVRSIVEPMKRLGELATDSAGVTPLVPSGLRDVDLVARRLHETMERLHAADRQKDEFLSTLAHELRNPLSPLLTAMTLLERKETLTPDGHRLIKMARRQLHQVDRLVNDLMEVGRAGLGKLGLDMKPFDLRDAISTAVETVNDRMRLKRQQLHVEPIPQELLVTGDPVRLTQVLCNLLDNASKYAPEGASVMLRGGRRDSQVQVSVQDTGQGMDPEHVQKVFDMFWQVPDGHGTSAGMGIGLALVKRLVEMHGGTVRAHSDGAGQGSTFTIELPAAAARSQGDQRPEPSQSSDSHPG